MSTLSSQPSMIRPSVKMTEDEFVRWADEDTHAEWVNGEVVIKMPIDRIHGAIQFWLRSLIQAFVMKRRLGFVEGPQFTMRMPTGPTRRDPDVMFVSAAREHLVTATYVNGPADLAVEVVSRESLSRDYREKFNEYEAAGVREYWIVDPLSKQVELYVLGAAARYAKVDAKDGKLFSAVLQGFWIRPEDPFKDPLPDVNALLAEIGA